MLSTHLAHAQPQTRSIPDNFDVRQQRRQELIADTNREIVERKRRQAEFDRKQNEIRTLTAIEENPTSKPLFIQKEYPYPKRGVLSAIEKNRNLEKKITPRVSFRINPKGENTLFELSPKAIGAFMYHVNPDLPLLVNGERFPDAVARVAREEGVFSPYAVSVALAEGHCLKDMPNRVTWSWGNEKYDQPSPYKDISWGKYTAKDGVVYRQYPDPITGLRAFCRKSQYHLDRASDKTTSGVLSILTPKSENDTAAHIATVVSTMRELGALNIWLSGRK